MGRTPYLNWFGKSSKKDEQIAENALRRTDTLHLADTMADELSGGEQQRVILARAFAQNTPLLLLDEPTTHLDIRFQMEFLELLIEHVQEENMSVIIAMHDLNQAMRFCDEVLLLSNGKIHASGKPRNVLTEKKLSSVYQYPIKIKDSEGDSPVFIYPKY
jgi:iron complex transport system ATP-binding protein